MIKPISREAVRDFVEFALIFLASLAMFYWSVYCIVIPPAYTTFEFCQYAEIGRNLATTGRFETRLLEPMALATIDRRVPEAAAPWPVVNRFPVPCFVIAGLFLLLGPSTFAAALSNGVATSLLAGLTFCTTARWLGRGWAYLGAALLLFNPSFYGYFILLGTPDNWFAGLMLAQLLCWVQLLRADRNVDGLLFGLLSGLALLTRFNMIIFVAIQGIVLLIRRQWLRGAIAALTITAVMSPFVVYNLQRLGTPIVSVYSGWNLLDEVGKYELEPWLYYEQPNVLVESMEHANGILTKAARNLLTIVPVRVWTLWHFYLLMPLALASPFLSRRDKARLFLFWAVGLFLFQLFVFSFLRLELENRLSPFHGRYFFWFAGPALIGATAVLQRIWSRGRFGQAVVALLVVGQLGFYASTWRVWYDQNTSVRGEFDFGHDPIRSAIGQIAQKDQIVACNHPGVLVWYQDLTSISLPADPQQLYMLNQTSPSKVDYLYISKDLLSIEMDIRWFALIDGGDFGASWRQQILLEYEYAIPRRLTASLDYVVLRRRTVPKSAFERQIEEQFGK